MTPTPQISEKQLEANRLNAQKSTGPRTEPGKARSRMNAGRHGLTGQVTLMTEDVRKAYNEFCNAMVRALQPEGPMETYFAQTIASDSWRNNRMKGVEDNIFAFGPTGPLRLDPETDPRINEAIAQTYTAMRNPNQLLLISLYTQRLDRAIAKNLAELKRLQAERRADRELELQQAAILAEQQAKAESTEINHLQAAQTVNGFVFSNDQIDGHRLRMQAQKALRHLKHSPPPRLKALAA